LLYQGANDPLIYPENATFMKQKLTAADTVILRTRLGGHNAYIWDQQALLKKEILRFVLRP
jgi:predicted alpha/beta-fold hydrolase